MKHHFAIALTLLALAGGFPSQGHAEEKAKTLSPPALIDDATMGKLLKDGEAAKEHRILATLIGIWDYDLKYWSDKNTEPQLSTGSISNEMVLGGRFLSGKTNVILNIGGQNIHYEGWSTLGYDTIKKEYNSVLIDAMHTGVTTGAAQYNEERKTFEEKGTFTHPLLDKEQTYRSELELTSDDTHKRTIFISDASGQEFKVLEIEFRRQR